MFLPVFSGGSSGLNDGDCRRFIWVFAVATSAMVAIFHFVIIARVYALWDRRARIKWILLVAFGIEISTTAVFTVLAAEEVKSFIKYDDFATHMCVLEKKPWALPFAVGALPVFDLFVIFMTVCNALDRPHRKQADIVTALIHDGVRMFLFNFGEYPYFVHRINSMLIDNPLVPVLSAVNFAMIIAGTTANFFATMPWVVPARMLLLRPHTPQSCLDAGVHSQLKNAASLRKLAIFPVYRTA
ncbi:hypothetical protein FB451DRAFT_1179658 [Mycena latifolia]|nr:hypothetical protein FB451DRAFT_1179658 [Mycena latifolia]